MKASFSYLRTEQEIFQTITSILQFGVPVDIKITDTHAITEFCRLNGFNDEKNIPPLIPFRYNFNEKSCWQKLNEPMVNFIQVKQLRLKLLNVFTQWLYDHDGSH